MAAVPSTQCGLWTASSVSTSVHPSCPSGLVPPPPLWAASLRTVPDSSVLPQPGCTGREGERGHVWVRVQTAAPPRRQDWGTQVLGWAPPGQHQPHPCPECRSQAGRAGSLQRGRCQAHAVGPPSGGPGVLCAAPPVPAQGLQPPPVRVSQLLGSAPGGPGPQEFFSVVFRNVLNPRAF